jgi:hypothetical protein
MPPQEQLLSQRQRYQPLALPQHMSDEELVRNWTLVESDHQEIARYRKGFRLYIALPICAVRVYGRFVNHVHDISPHILNYLGQQLDLPPSLTVEAPEREATALEHRSNVLKHVGFQRFDPMVQAQLAPWIEQQARRGMLPEALCQQAEKHLLAQRVLLPGPSVLERLIMHICSNIHDELFAPVFKRLSPELRQAIDQLLLVPDGEQHSAFAHLKEYPPAPSIASIQAYLQRYRTVAETGINACEIPVLTPEWLAYLYKQAKRYNAKDLKRFTAYKRSTRMVCFLLETRKTLLDHLVTMHDQYLMEITRQTHHAHAQKHRELRKRQKRAIDVMLDTTDFLLEWPDEQPLSQHALWHQGTEGTVRNSRQDLREFQRLEERGYGDLLLNRYPSLRKYFADVLHLPCAAKPGNEPLLHAIDLVRQLDAGEVKRLPPTAPRSFVPKELRRALHDQEGKLNRNAWEMGLALAIKDALRSGDLYLPQSKH